MKTNDFKKLSNILSKTVRSFELCFDKVTVEKASITYANEEYRVEFEAYIEDLGIGEFKTIHESDSAHDLLKLILDDIIKQIDSHLEKNQQAEIKFKRYWDENKIYSNEFSYLSSVASLEMIKEVVVSMLPTSRAY